ncbi:MAG: DNA polymerase IV, partial [Pseudomonadota bacterium]
ASHDILDGHIWRMAEKVADRAKAKGIVGRVVILKLKRADHSLITRRHTIHEPTNIADKLYREARALFDAVEHDAPYRLLGVGMSELSKAESGLAGDLLDPEGETRAKAELATDKIRARFGTDAIMKGRALH